MDRKNLARRGLGAFSLLMSGLVGGCCSTDTGCGVPGDWPRFGSAMEHFAADTLRLPTWAATETERRAHLLNESGRGVVIGRERECSDSVDTLASVWPWTCNEFGRRLSMGTDFVCRQGSRAVDDACCLPQRVWHTFKVATE